MATNDDNEEDRLRSVAFRNAQSVLHARRAAEETLRKQSEWLRVTLASIGDAVISTDAESRVTLMNGVAETLTAREQAEVLGRPLSEIFRIVDERTREPVEIPALRALGQEKTATLANRTILIAKDGTERPIDVSVAPIREEQARVAGCVLVFRDVTERRRTEQALQRSEEDLRDLLTSEKAARAEAERASRLKEDFLATLSHEIRTPLNAVLGWAQILMKRTDLDEELAQGLTVIDRNARIQAQLIADLLDMSRIISGKMRLEVQRVELPVVIEAALDSVLPAAEAKEIRIQRLLEPITDPVRGDPSRLQQIVWNLLSNAVKFTPRGGRVQVVLARVNSHVEISVSDTGKGIKPEFLPHVFERFRQGDSSAGREQGGLGLGLAIVKQLVDLHGGDVRVTSAGEGKGSTFTVHLPLAVIHASPEEAKAHPRAVSLSPVDSESPNLAGVRVLVVDDELDARDLLKRVLEACGAEVMLAASADQALRIVESRPPDVILSDIGMPERDGYAFMKAIRGRGLRIPAAAFTAFARSEDRTRALQAGYHTHIAKPVETAELLATVASLAQMKTVGSEGG